MPNPIFIPALIVGDVGESVIFHYIAVTGAYAISRTDRLVNCTANTFTVTLPTAVGAVGKEYVIKNSGAGAITVATTGGQKIDGVATATIVGGASLTVDSDGANWLII